jgi:molybdopterin/thiamine biosynthesis adenylyltransferase/rhodanese-related sulfurtransferase
MSRAPSYHRQAGVAPDDILPALDPDELLRYSRHIRLAEVGEAGQRRLKQSGVLIVGAGGLGSPAALYLAAAGVGRIGIVDFDAVDLSNLQRQVLHDTPSVGVQKTASARSRLTAINPHVHVDTFDDELTAANALEIIGDYDVVVDGTDNFRTRYLTNDACVLLGRPNVYGSVLRFEGQASVFATPDGPCYRCLFREPPPPGLVPSCAEAGVLGVLPGLVGTIQATEAIKLLLGAGDSLVGRLLLIDGLRMRFRTIQLRRDPECPACGTRELKELVDYDEFCSTGSAADTRQRAVGVHEVAPSDLADRLRRGEAVELIDVRESYEWRIGRIEGARHLPLDRLGANWSDLPRDRDIVLYCHHGARSRAAAEFLAAQGFDSLWNLSGGIDRWSVDVDPSIRRY